ncbi:MAG: tyrosine-type recombinase/integrase [Gemmatimonadota bacterium]|nr:tyrosine-type recombinase/integrase [Gemmatimonadota bacterium]
MYGSGLRLAECTSLRVKDIDFDRGEIMVRGGKGDKDRRVPLPRLAIPALRIQIERVRAQFERDLRSGITGSALPGAMDRKTSTAERDWRWQYLFPATRVHSEHGTGKRRRYQVAFSPQYKQAVQLPVR